MARPFTVEEANKIISQHSSLSKQMVDADMAFASNKAGIKEAANAMVAGEALAILRGIDVEELNKDKKGIRVKTLKEGRFNTVADIYTAPLHSISTLNGISEDGAKTIKSLANAMAKEVTDGLKIKLSVDNKNDKSTALVKALYIYKHAVKPLNQLRDLSQKHGHTVKLAVDAVRPACGTFKWMFTSQATKDKAIDGYNALVFLMYGDYGKQSIEALTKINEVFKASPNAMWADFEKDSVTYFNILENIDPGLLGASDAVYGLPEDLAREIEEQQMFPDGLLCTLRRYQEWGVKYILHQERVLLGDEMGLGKTVQAIAAMVSLKNTGAKHFVVVCPASVLSNWCREVVKFSKLKVIKIHGADKDASWAEFLKTGGVAVTTYETTSTMVMPEGMKLDMIIVDEAHYIKNPEAQRTKNVKALCKYSDRLLFMTGTALENNVEEMIRLIAILNPKVADDVDDIAFMSKAGKFRERIAPVYYRRKREDVLTELPELIEKEEWCTLGKKEEEAYEASVLSRNFADARRVSWNVEDIKESSKANRLIELVEEAAADGRKVIVFSFFLDTIKKVCEILNGRCLEPITGSVSPNRRQEIVDEFGKNAAGSVLCAQIQSGGTGLNIQAASVVILCEPQFKPSIENQAISRAYRMGQARNVLVYRLLADDTVDERIVEILAEKQKIFDAFADKSVAAQETLELDEKSFGNIIDEEIERIKGKNK